MRITATTGNIIVSEFKNIGSARTFDLGSYKLSFNLTSKVPSSGYIELIFPIDFTFTSMNESDFSCIFTAGLSISLTSCSFF